MEQVKLQILVVAGADPGEGALGAETPLHI